MADAYRSMRVATSYHDPVRLEAANRPVRTGAGRRWRARSRIGFVELLLVGSLLVVLAACALLSRTPSALIEHTATVMVAPGETLWNLARENPIDGCSTAQTVAVIRKINGIEANMLIAGSEVRVPARPGNGVALR